MKLFQKLKFKNHLFPFNLEDGYYLDTYPGFLWHEVCELGWGLDDEIIDFNIAILVRCNYPESAKKFSFRRKSNVNIVNIFSKQFSFWIVRGGEIIYNDYNHTLQMYV